MNKLLMKYPLMGEEPAPNGEGEGGGGGEDKGPTPKTTLLEGGEGEGTEGGEGKDPTPAKSGSLLDDGAGTEDGEDAAKKADGADAAKAPTAEEIDEWCKGVPELDLGDGVKWDNAALKAMAPSLMGLKKEESGRVIKAYAEYTKAQAKAQAEAADSFNNGLIQECQKRFGEDLQKIAGYAKTGGREIFGDKIWNEMKAIPQFANNPDIMEKLAEFGRRVSTDGGKITPKGGETDDAQKGDILHRMYGNVGA